MSLGNALTFVKRASVEQPFRDRLNRAATLSEIHDILKEEDLAFKPGEIEDAFNSLLVKCQTWEQAEQIKELKMWWEMLQQIVSPTSCSSHCSGGCCG